MCSTIFASDDAVRAKESRNLISPIDKVIHFSKGFGDGIDPLVADVFVNLIGLFDD